MKASTLELDALLATKQAVIADLFTITLADGTLLRLTSAPDFDVWWQGHNYDRSLVIERGDITSSVGVEVDEVELTLYVRPNDAINGITLSTFVHNGGFDGARVLIEWAFMTTPGLPVGAIHLFEGALYEPVPARTLITMTASSDMILLDQMVPKNIITPDCGNRLGDSLCGVNKALYTHAGTVQAGSNKSVIVTNLTQADDYFRLGSIVFTSGPNVGAKRSIKWHKNGIIQPSYPFYYQPAVGDTFTATTGCDRTRPTCVNKFGNEDHIRLFPYVPTPVASA